MVANRREEVVIMWLTEYTLAETPFAALGRSVTTLISITGRIEAEESLLLSLLREAHTGSSSTNMKGNTQSVTHRDFY